MRGVEIGDEPPLRADGEEPGSSRSVNIRWFASTILAGVLGMGLLGATIVTSLNGVTNMASPGVFARWDPYSGRAGRGTNSVRKGDQIALGRGVDEDRQTFRVSTTSKVGNREIVRTRPVTRIAANLSLAAVNVDIPKFNPAAMFAENDEPLPPADAEPASDGDISYVVRDLKGMRIGTEEGPTTPLDEVLASVRDTAAMEMVQSNDFQAAFGGIEAPGLQTASLASLAPAPNVTVVAKTSTRATASGNDGERVVTAQANERLADILLREGASAAEARDIADAFGAQSGYGTMGLQAGQTVRILMAPLPNGRQQPVRIIVTNGKTESIVALSDTGGYVSVADAPEIAMEGEIVTEDQESASAGDLSLYQSFYGTALMKGVPKPVIEELVRVFSYDADFQRKAGRGDSFQVLYVSDDAGQVDGKPEILYTSLVSGGEVRRYYRYQAPDGTVDYYDEEGRSARKFLVRKPIAQAVLRSGFGLRRHPILGYSKMHTGVDWGAPRGTPIYAAGNGVIEYAERKGGYGNQVKIRHANGYETAYGHMSGFARGLKPGMRVRQGQVIGYVGSTGLSTGPHLHYEVLVNGRFVNPMRIKVPRGQELEGPALAEFQRERERIDALAGNTDTGSAQLTQAQRSQGG